MSAGQVSVPVSVTVTVKLQVANRFPDVSLAAQITVVAPAGNVDPDAGSQVTVPQLPDVVGEEYVTSLLHPLLVLSVISDGHVRVQLLLSTVTVNVQFAELFEASVAVQVTVVAPVGKLDPEGGAQAT